MRIAAIIAKLPELFSGVSQKRLPAALTSGSPKIFEPLLAQFRIASGIQPAPEPEQPRTRSKVLTFSWTDYAAPAWGRFLLRL